MLDRVERLPPADPDFNRLLTVLRRQRPDRVPLLELKLDSEVVSSLLAEPLIPWKKSAAKSERHRALHQNIDLMRRLGYDAFRLRAPLHFQTDKISTVDTAGLSRGQRQWQNEHTGPIQSWEDFEAYSWPTAGALDFTEAEEIGAALPDGMGCIGYCSGVFEWSTWLLGLETFLLGIHDNRDLIAAVTDRVGMVIHEVFEVFCQMDHVVALWIGDDLGFKTAPLMSPADLRDFILPWHRRYAELAHANGLPFLLHCCGNVREIMADLVEDVCIDAKHSFEDVIQPVEDFHREWGTAVAVIGGVDIDILARGDEATISDRTERILEQCAPRGAYAAGSGNSITNYIPVSNYLAMVETVHRFNGRL